MELTVDHLLVEKNGRRILETGLLNFGGSGLIGLIGPNGAGKSTLLKAVCGLENPASGQVLLGGRRLADLPAAERAALIGYIPQHFQPCWNQKIAELLHLAAERTGDPRRSFQESVEKFELRSFLDRHWDSLSGGERGRVALAMALSGNPPLVLADEPGAALDIGHNLQMLAAFKARADKCLLVVCLHDLNLGLRFFDRILLMREGRPACFGRAEELLGADLLNETFGVDFLKIKTEIGWLIQPRTADLDAPSFFCDNLLQNRKNS